MTVMREKFSSQADPKLLAKVREIAEKEGRQFQSVLEEALAEYLDRHQKQKPRTHVMEALGLSIEEYDELYQKLAS
jgi:predicted transcriptional regulator